MDKKEEFMKKLLKPSYMALIIFVLLGVFVIFIDKGKREKEEKISVFVLKEENITKIELIDIEKNTDIICSKSDSGLWEVISPKKYEVDKDTINGIINNFINLAVDRKIAGGINLKSFGLDNPKFKIKVFTTDNKENTLIIGNLSPTQNLYYVKDHDKDPVYTVYSYCIDGMRKDLKSLRKKIDEFKEKDDKDNSDEESSK